jgi:hypothetical protein
MNELNSTDITFVKGSLRYKGAPEVGIKLDIPLESKLVEIEEFDRSAVVDLALLFNRDRQKSTIFIPTCKFRFIFENTYSGKTGTASNPYTPFNGRLFYYNEAYYRTLQALANNNEIQWAGFPQYKEFTFLRTDNSVDGYTSGNNPHINFENSKADKYNWLTYVTYAYSSSTAAPMVYSYNTQSYGFYCGDGIPYYMRNAKMDGKKMWQIICPVNHGLSVGEFVNLGFSYNGTNLFEVYSLGDGTFNSEYKIFNIYDVGFLVDPGNPQFYDGRMGTFKRVTQKDSPQESTSRYYVRLHKILTNTDDSLTTLSGFELNSFREVKKFFSAAATPNGVSRLGVKEDSQSYNVSFNNPIDINNLLDNNKRPLSEIYFTVINKGQFGWFHPVLVNEGTSLKQGWDFNLDSEYANWWARNNAGSDTNLPTTQYTKGQFTFNYTAPLNVGDVIPGDFCEWNDLEQTERVISEYYHKMVYNPNVFDIAQVDQNIPMGYYYQPHYKMTLRVFSDYIEQGDKKTIDNVPRYAFFSESNNSFIWRDLYDYGFIDADGLGVDYPFMNGRHYPYDNFIFRLIPEGSNLGPLNGTVQIPTFDGCE